jgi:hypothetical protein
VIFKPELVRAIQQGRKTMTRRPVKPRERDCRYKPEHVYSIQPGRGRKAVCQITVMDVRMEYLGNLSLEDARREGFRTTADFYAYWQRLYGPPDSAGVRDLERRLAQLDPETEAARAFIASIEESRRRRAASLPLPAQPCMVWVISFVKGDVRDAPRLLRGSAPDAPVCKAPLRGPDGKVIHKPGSPLRDAAGEIIKQRLVLCNRAFRDGQTTCICGAHRPDETGEDHGYTTRTRQAMADEPEAISIADEARIVKAAREKPVLTGRQLWQRERREIEEAIERAGKGINSRAVTSELRLLLNRLAKIDRKVERAA